MKKLNWDTCVCGDWIKPCEICGVEYCPSCDDGWANLCEECAFEHGHDDDERDIKDDE